MKTLAELSFKYIWLLLFEDEDVIDPDYSVKQQDLLPDYFAAMSDEEKAALSQVAEEVRARLLAEPDEHGYTPRKLVTEDQKEFLDALSSGELFENIIHVVNASYSLDAVHDPEEMDAKLEGVAGRAADARGVAYMSWDCDSEAEALSLCKKLQQVQNITVEITVEDKLGSDEG